MTDRKVFDLFYGAREGDDALMRRAYETGVDINFGFDGRRATKGGAGRWYYGDLQWYAPDGINGDKTDTLLIIAVKNNNAKLVEWLLGLDGLDTNRKNGKGLDAMAVAKALGREHLLLGIAAAGSPPAAAAETPVAKGAVAVNPVDGALPPPLPPGRDGGDAAEIARLCNAVKMLKTTNEDKEAEVTQAKRDCDAYQQMLKEKDASIGELQKSVLDKEKEVIVMLHKIGRLEEALRDYTDFRGADAEQYTEWGKADYYNAEASAGNAPGGPPEKGS